MSSYFDDLKDNIKTSIEEYVRESGDTDGIVTDVLQIVGEALQNALGI